MPKERKNVLAAQNKRNNREPYRQKLKVEWWFFTWRNPENFATPQPSLWASGSMRMICMRSTTRNLLCLVPSLRTTVTARRSELLRSSTSPAWTHDSGLERGRQVSFSPWSVRESWRRRKKVLIAFLALSTSPQGSLFRKSIPVRGVPKREGC